MWRRRSSERALSEALRRAAELLSSWDRALVVGHRDADGVTATAIALRTLEAMGIEAGYEIVQELSSQVLASLASRSVPIWFVDIGAGWLPQLKGLRFVLTDHHPPREAEIPEHVRRDIGEFAELTSDLYGGAVIPEWYGYSGSFEISGAGVTYLLSREILGRNGYLASLAVVGALGDLQDEATGRLEGLNRRILSDAVAEGNMEVELDLRSFGRSSRPAIQYLRFVSDPVIPGVTQCGRCVEAFLRESGIEPGTLRARSWEELPREDKRRIVSALVRKALEFGLEPDEISRLIGESYTLVGEEKTIRDAKEFATLLNACVRQGETELAVSLAKGERGATLLLAEEVAKAYRRQLFESLKIVSGTLGLQRRGAVAYFHAGPLVPDSIVGVVTSILMSRYGSAIPVLVGLADTDDMVKASVRLSPKLKGGSLHLGTIVSRSAEAVGGYGGGHAVAAGATIPRGSEEGFIELLVRMVEESLNNEVEL